MAVADAVVARQVRRRLGGADQIVGGDGVLGVRQRDRDDLRPGAAELVERRAHRRLDLGVHAGLKILGRHAEPHAGQSLAPCARRLTIGADRRRDRRRVERIDARHDLQQRRGVLDGAAERPRVIERRGEGDDAVARDAPVGRLHPDHPAERRRLPDRAAGIGPGRARAQRCRHRRRRAARRSARHVRGRPGVARRLDRAVLRRRAHRELVHVQLAERDGAGRLQARRHRRLVRGNEPAQDLRGAGGLDPAHAEDVLDPDGGAGQRSRIAPRLAGGVDGVGPTAGAAVVDLQEASQRSVQPGCPIQELLGHLARAESTGAHAVDDRNQAGPARVDHDSSSTVEDAARSGDDAGNLEEAGLAPGGVRQGLVDRQRRRRLVGPQRTVEGNGVRHRLDACRVELAHGVDIVEDGVQIDGHPGDLLLGERQARQDRQLADFVGSYPGHTRPVS